MLRVCQCINDLRATYEEGLNRYLIISELNDRFPNKELAREMEQQAEDNRETEERITKITNDRFARRLGYDPETVADVSALIRKYITK